MNCKTVAQRLAGRSWVYDPTTVLQKCSAHKQNQLLSVVEPVHPLCLVRDTFMVAYEHYCDGALDGLPTLEQMRARSVAAAHTPGCVYEIVFQYQLRQRLVEFLGVRASVSSRDLSKEPSLAPLKIFKVGVMSITYIRLTAMDCLHDPHAVVFRVRLARPLLPTTRFVVHNADLETYYRNVCCLRERNDSDIVQLVVYKFGYCKPYRLILWRVDL